jgi:hypothetical protein
MTSNGVTCFLHTVGDPDESWYEKPFSPFSSFLAGRTQHKEMNGGSWRDTPEGDKYWRAYLRRTRDTLSVANFSGGKFTHLSEPTQRRTKASDTNGTRVRRSGEQTVPSSTGNTRQSSQPVRLVDDDRITAATKPTRASVPYDAIAKRRAAIAAAASTAASQTTTKQQSGDSRKPTRVDNPRSGRGRRPSREGPDLEIDPEGCDLPGCGDMWDGLGSCFGEFAKACGDLKID